MRLTGLLTRRTLPCLASALLLGPTVAACGGDEQTTNAAAPPLSREDPQALSQKLDERALLALATDGDAPTDNEPLWIIRARGRSALSVQLLRIGKASGFGKRRVITTIRRPPSSPSGVRGGSRTTPGAFYDVARWDPSDTAAYVFILRPERRGVRVTLRNPGAPERRFADGVAPIAAAPRGVRRDLAIATWSGLRPDLFVIDRGAENERLHIAVFSGESKFQEPLLRLRVPLRGLDPRVWDVDVGRATQPQPDLVFFTRDPRRRRSEVHVLVGEANFQRFGYQRELALRSGLPPSYLLRFAVVRGVEGALGIDLRRPPGRIEVFPFFSRPGLL